LRVYDNQFNGLLPSCSLPGRGVLIPRSVFNVVGLYDEKKFPHYAADMDFSVRAENAGYKLFVDADNPVYSPYEPDRIDGTKLNAIEYLKTFFNPRTANYIPVWVSYTLRHAHRKWYAPIELGFEAARRLSRIVRF